jgi:hypothetical protein
MPATERGLAAVGPSGRSRRALEFSVHPCGQASGSATRRAVRGRRWPGRSDSARRGHDEDPPRKRAIGATACHSHGHRDDGDDARSSGRGGDGYPQKGLGENCGKRRDANGERESCVGSSVIRMITITALFHPARHWRRRHGRRLGSDSLGRSRRRSRCRNRGRELKARQIFENAIEIAALHRMLLHHGRHGSGELIDFPRSDTT